MNIFIKWFSTYFLVPSHVFPQTISALAHFTWCMWAFYATTVTTTPQDLFDLNRGLGWSIIVMCVIVMQLIAHITNNRAMNKLGCLILIVCFLFISTLMLLSGAHPIRLTPTIVLCIFNILIYLNLAYD